MLALVAVLVGLVESGGSDGSGSDDGSPTAGAPPTSAAPASPTRLPSPSLIRRSPVSDASSGLRVVALADLPREAQATVALIDQGGPFPYAQDGVTFGNYEGVLPAHPRGWYREYTVRTPGEPDRGPRRIVTGNTTAWSSTPRTTTHRSSRCPGDGRGGRRPTCLAGPGRAPGAGTGGSRRGQAADRGWYVALVPAAETDADLWDGFAGALDLPGWFGRNLDALDEVLRDRVRPTALVLAGWSTYASARPERWRSLLHLLRGWASEPDPGRPDLGGRPLGGWSCCRLTGVRPLV